MELSSFKTYDVRGLYGSEITEELAYLIGNNLPKLFNTNTIAVGRDSRLSSPSLQNSLIKGLTNVGCFVIDLGIVSTPMLNFAVVKLNLLGGVMISASHNPPEYNAFKIIGKNAQQLSTDTGLSKLKELIEQSAPSTQESTLLSNVKKYNILPEYTEHILSVFNINKKIKVVCDYGNGVGSVNGVTVFNKITNVEAIHLYKDLDGTFPNHYADPHHIENMESLRRKVLETKADLGLFFDGDADRCYFIDEKANVLLADMSFCLLAEKELIRNKSANNKNVYYDLRFTKEIENVVRKSGGNPVMLRVGNPFYKEKLTNQGGIIASEFSGHIMYNQHFNIDDGLFAGLKMIEILSNSNLPLSKLVNKYRTYVSTPETSISVEGKNIDLIISKLKNEFKDGEEIVLDGLYIKYPDFWFNLRKSNTEPVVRLRIEADNEKILDLQKSKILNIINT